MKRCEASKHAVIFCCQFSWGLVPDRMPPALVSSPPADRGNQGQRSRLILNILFCANHLEQALTLAGCLSP